MNVTSSFSVPKSHYENTVLFIPDNNSENYAVLFALFLSGRNWGSRGLTTCYKVENRGIGTRVQDFSLKIPYSPGFSTLGRNLLFSSQDREMAQKAEVIAQRIKHKYENQNPSTWENCISLSVCTCACPLCVVPSPECSWSSLNPCHDNTLPARSIHTN